MGEDDGFTGVSPFDFAMRQKTEEKKRKEREREAKAQLYKYHSQGVATLEEANALKVNAENEKGKQAARQMKEDATKVNMAVAGFGVEQASRNADFVREKARQETERNTKKENQNVVVTETVETNELKALAARDKAEKETERQTKAHLKDVNITESVEGQVRKEQHKMEKDWKETGKQQKAENTNFDMARALF